MAGYFRGELSGEPIITDEAGRSRRLLSRSTSLSKLHSVSQRRKTDAQPCNLLQCLLAQIGVLPFCATLS